MVHSSARNGALQCTPYRKYRNIAVCRRGRSRYADNRPRRKPKPMTAPDPYAQWRALVAAEAKACGHALVAILRCRRRYPALWRQVEQQPASQPTETQPATDHCDEKGI